MWVKCEFLRTTGGFSPATTHRHASGGFMDVTYTVNIIPSYLSQTQPWPSLTYLEITYSFSGFESMCHIADILPQIVLWEIINLT